MSEARVKITDLTSYELAHLRIAAFAALQNWGSTRNAGNWKAWNWTALEEKADALVAWATTFNGAPVTPMHPGDLGIEETRDGD